MLKMDGLIPVYTWDEGMERERAGETGLWIQRECDGTLNLRYTSHKTQLCGEVDPDGTGFCPEPPGLNNFCNDVLVEALERKEAER